MLSNSYTPDWFSNFLDTIPAEQTTREVQFLAQHIPAGSLVLDVCCGTGRHALPLAERGCRVIGIDVNDVALANTPDHPNCTFRKHDMRRISELPETFDAIICMWQSFGYFDSKTNLDILRQMAAKLRHGGYLVLDIYNRGFFETHQGQHEHDRNGLTIRTEQTMQDDRLTVRLEYGMSLDVFEWQLFTVDDIQALAETVGLTCILACANFDAVVSPSASIPRMQVVFEKSV